MLECKKGLCAASSMHCSSSYSKLLAEATHNWHRLNSSMTQHMCMGDM
jgi:hypothetical protein